ncbi:MAG: murein biosynthesis integral membrane protein MurJ [Firmicutes bacterium]|nr:murein biosynthesis integral membrane protein MurJ [Bacillota bacterium]
MDKESAAGTVAAIIALTAFSKALGLFRESVVAACYGAGAVTDAYLVAGTVVALVLNLLGGRALGTAFIPVYAGIAASGAQWRAERFAGTVLLLSLAAFILAAMACSALAPVLAGVVAPGFGVATGDMAVYFIRLLALGIPLLALVGFWSALLNLRGHFLVPAALGIPLNLAVAVLAWKSGAQPYGLAVGTLTGYLLQLLLLWLVLKKFRAPVFTRPHIREPGIFQMGGLLVPMVAGGLITQFNPLVNRVVASGLPEGAISALGYADRLIQVPLGLLVTAVITAGYPSLSRAFTGGNCRRAKEMVVAWSGILLYAVVPTACFFALHSHCLVKLVFQRGAFTADAAAVTAGALFYFSLGLPCMAWGRLLARAFYARRDAATPMLIGICAVGVNIFFCLTLAGPMGPGGIALATTLASFTGLLLLLACLGFKIGSVFNRQMRVKVLSISAAAAAQVLVMLALSAPGDGVGERSPAGSLCFLIINGTAGMLAYFLVTRFLRLEEAMLVTGWLKKAVSRRREK